MRSMVRFAAAGLLAGCLDTIETTEVRGSPADFTTPAGMYAGYDVVRGCPANRAAVGVIGTGTTVISDVQAMGAAGSELGAELADVPSLHGSGGFGLACLRGVGTFIYLDDWRDLDPVVARTGAYLRARDLALQVGIHVESIPVAH